MDTTLVTQQLQAGYNRPPTQVTSHPANRRAVHAQVTAGTRDTERVQPTLYPSLVSLKSLNVNASHISGSLIRGGLHLHVLRTPKNVRQ
jgi:hypothetical protein